MPVCCPADAVELMEWLKLNDLAPLGNLFTASPLLKRQSKSKFPLAGFPETTSPKLTQVSSLQEGAAWFSEAGVRSPKVQFQLLL